MICQRFSDRIYGKCGKEEVLVCVPMDLSPHVITQSADRDIMILLEEYFFVCVCVYFPPCH